jgi:hypothetical protein
MQAEVYNCVAVSIQEAGHSEELAKPKMQQAPSGR